MCILRVTTLINYSNLMTSRVQIGVDEFVIRDSYRVCEGRTNTYYFPSLNRMTDQPDMVQIVLRM